MTDVSAAITTSRIVTVRSLDRLSTLAAAAIPTIHTEYCGEKTRLVATDTSTSASATSPGATDSSLPRRRCRAITPMSPMPSAVMTSPAVVAPGMTISKAP